MKFSTLVRSFTPLFLVSMLAGLVWAPVDDAGEMASVEADEWFLPVDLAPVRGGAEPDWLAALPWWGGISIAAPEDTQANLEEREESWRLLGVIEIGSNSFALVQEAEEQPGALQRVVPGELLPGGERLVRITGQGIRVTVGDNDDSPGIERKLYAPRQ